MNITPISSRRINYYKPKNKIGLSFQANFLKQLIENTKDSFTPQNNQNKVTLKEYYSKKLDNFTLEAVNYIMKSPKITYQGLYDILRKYSNDIKLRKYEGQNLNKKTVAQYVLTNSYINTILGVKEEKDSEIIYINTPKKLDKSSRARFLGSFVHETVHMFQEDSRMEVLKESYLKKYYAKTRFSNPWKETTEAIDKLYYGFTKFEQNIFTLMGNFLTANLKKKKTSLEDFDKYLLQYHDAGLEDLSKFLIEDTYCNTGDSIIKTLGKEAIVDYMKFKLEKEVEAYEAEDKVLQQYSPDYAVKAESKLCIDVYKKLFKIANNLKLEEIN